jgi:hypothetical protein
VGRFLLLGPADIEPERSFVFYPGSERHGLAANTWATDLASLCREVATA